MDIETYTEIETYWKLKHIQEIDVITSSLRGVPRRRLKHLETCHKHKIEESKWRCITCQTLKFPKNKRKGDIWLLKCEACPGGKDHITIENSTVRYKLPQNTYLCVIIS